MFLITPSVPSQLSSQNLWPRNRPRMLRERFRGDIRAGPESICVFARTCFAMSSYSISMGHPGPRGPHTRLMHSDPRHWYGETRRDRETHHTWTQLLIIGSNYLPFKKPDFVFIIWLRQDKRSSSLFSSGLSLPLAWRDQVCDWERLPGSWTHPEPVSCQISWDRQAQTFTIPPHRLCAQDLCQWSCQNSWYFTFVRRGSLWIRLNEFNIFFVKLHHAQRSWNWSLPPSPLSLSSLNNSIYLCTQSKPWI